jgi:hypothetical protein
MVWFTSLFLGGLLPRPALPFSTPKSAARQFPIARHEWRQSATYNRCTYRRDIGNWIFRTKLIIQIPSQSSLHDSKPGVPLTLWTNAVKNEGFSAKKFKK